MKPALLSGTLIGVMALIAIAVWFFFDFSHTPQQRDRIKIKMGASVISLLNEGQAVKGRWITFTSPSVVCDSLHALRKYSHYEAAADVNATTAMLVTSDHPSGDCASMDSNVRFAVKSVGHAVPDSQRLIELGGTAEPRSYWTHLTDAVVVVQWSFSHVGDDATVQPR